MFDMMKMMGKIKEVQEKMKEAQVSLSNITVESESGAGMVKVTVNGKKQLVKLDIDDSILTSDDKQLATDLIIAAVNKGVEEAEQKAQEHIKKSTEGLMPNIPGLDLNNLV
ncbi:MAG: YbaB/EbfC family nucleoid-associated protein [Cyclobacteriaceae bacterium]|nr:YbaB/EbfC family nucleoid-associated protein [Cyclobacteriaceae bacterium HetDA_MAG_MS6]